MQHVPKVILEKAVETLTRGGVIAYPTESVFGLGADPWNVDAVTQILILKKRSIRKGFILIGSSMDQFESLIEPIDPRCLARVESTWPGPVTWVFPASTHVPKWVRGDHETIAIRVTDHPVAHALCKAFGRPIISTSANVEGEPPARDARTAKYLFPDQLDMVVPGKTGHLARPTPIRDAITGEMLRD